MRKSLFVVGVFAVALSVAPACATKKFVRTSVGEVNEKVGTIGKSLEETQERVRTLNEPKIGEVDQKAGRGQPGRRRGPADRRIPPPARPPRRRKSARAPTPAPPASKRRPAS